MSHTSSSAEDSLQTSDRRRHARQRIKSLSYLDLGPGNGGIVLNISEGGLAVQAVGIFIDNPMLRIDFQLPQSDQQLGANGLVAWTCESTREAGIQFVDLPEESRTLIKEWVSKQAPQAEPRAEGGPAREKKKQVLQMRAARESKTPVPEASMTDGMANDRFKAIFPAENASAPPREFAPPAANSAATVSVPAATNVSPLPSESATPHQLEVETPMMDSISAIEREIKATRDKLSGLRNPAKFTKFVPSFITPAHEITNEELRALFPSENSAPVPPQVNASAANSRSGVAPIPTAPSVEPPRSQNATLSHPEVVAPDTDPTPEIRNPDDATASPFFIEATAHVRPKTKAPDASFLLALPIPPAPEGSPFDSEEPAPPRFDVDSPTANSLSAAESEIGPSTELLSDMPAIFEPTNLVHEPETSYEATKKELYATPQFDSAAGVRDEVAAPVTIPRSVGPILSAPSISISRHEKSVSEQPGVKSPLEGILSGTRIPRAAENRPAKDDRIIPSFWTTCRTLIRAGWRPAVVFGLIFVVLLATWMAFERGAFDGLREKMSSSTGNPVIDATPPAPDTVKIPQAAKTDPGQGVDSTPQQKVSSTATASVAPPEKPPQHAQGGQMTEPQRPKSFVWTLSPPIVANRAVQGGTPENENPPAIQDPPGKENGDSLPVAAVGSWDSSAKLAPPQPAAQISEQGDRLVASSLLYRVEPIYPPEAIQNRVEGTVKLRAVIGRDGRVKGLGLMSGPPPLVSAAMSAAREWRFIPALLNGEPVESETDINIEFRVSHEAGRQ
jgi:periplasmic protein TonB